MKNLKDKYIWITGASDGIGKELAIQLAKKGAHIILTARNVAKLNQVKDRLAGSKHLVYPMDLLETDAIPQKVNELLQQIPTVDILINNAGTIKRAPAQEHEDAIWDHVIEVNQTAQFIITREIGKNMIARGSGKIVFTASLLTYQGGITVPGYAASKGAIGQMTKAFANEWASKGVNVNAIAPGYISTDNTEALQNDPERSKAILSRIPAGRWGNPKDFAGPIVFLCSQASNYMHGSVLLVDGGWMGR